VDNKLREEQWMNFIFKWISNIMEKRPIKTLLITITVFVYVDGWCNNVL